MNEQSRSDSSRLVFAADLGGTHLRMALIDENGLIVAHAKNETPKDDKPDGVVSALVTAAQAYETDPSFHSRIMGASIMVPGAVDKDNAIIVQAPNLPALNQFPLKQALQQRLGWTVVLENDANAAAVGEMWLGAARGCSNIVCITLGTGVGGGIILNGKLWRGTDGGAGEIGHTTVEPFGGPKCKCGSTGCLEMFASATAVVRLAHEASSSVPNSPLRDGDLTSLKVYEIAKSGDELALGVFKKVGTYLGVSVANVINLLNPEVVVVGGGVVNGWDLFVDHLLEQVAERAFGCQAQKVKILPAECGDNAGILGAARLAFEKVSSN